MRAIVIFVHGLALVRIVGCRVFGKWPVLDIIVSIIIGSSLSRAMTANAPMVGTLAASTLLMGLHWILAQLAACSMAVSRLVEGKPRTVAQNGGLRQSALRHD
jgi:uncharacterized membrane protein YcaP (DUF421 family)